MLKHIFEDFSIKITLLCLVLSSIDTTTEIFYSWSYLKELTDVDSWRKTSQWFRSNVFSLGGLCNYAGFLHAQKSWNTFVILWWFYDYIKSNNTAQLLYLKTKVNYYNHNYSNIRPFTFVAVRWGIRLWVTRADRKAPACLTEWGRLCCKCVSMYCKNTECDQCVPISFTPKLMQITTRSAKSFANKNCMASVKSSRIVFKKWFMIWKHPFCFS